MTYESELLFFRKLLKNFHLSSYILIGNEEIEDFDLGLRRLLFPDIDYTKLFCESIDQYRPNTIYKISDEYLCNYIFFNLPETSTNKFLMIGPYTHIEHPHRVICNAAEKLRIPVAFLPQLEKFYADLPLIPDESILFALINTLGETMWGSLENFSLEYITRTLPATHGSDISPTSYAESQDAPLSMHILEERYANENRMIQAISYGQTHKIEMILTEASRQGIEERISDPVRNIKNYSIVLNTLLRKAAEVGAVHPFHIDALSSRFAREIELIHSPEEGFKLHMEMMRKYSLLVKNHSLKGYSLLIRKVLTQIDYDLTADLSLKAQADLLNINASYLSTLFKKETGMTLTDYVNRKRVEHAITLLNTTDLQIQTIAQHCGVPDVNYFTKTFKKYIHKTPKEYREDITTTTHSS